MTSKTKLTDQRAREVAMDMVERSYIPLHRVDAHQHGDDLGFLAWAAGWLIGQLDVLAGQNEDRYRPSMDRWSSQGLHPSDPRDTEPDAESDASEQEGDPDGDGWYQR